MGTGCHFALLTAILEGSLSIFHDYAALVQRVKRRGEAPHTTMTFSPFPIPHPSATLESATHTNAEPGTLTVCAPKLQSKPVPAPRHRHSQRFSDCKSAMPLQNMQLQKLRLSYGQYGLTMKIADFAVKSATKTFAAATNGLQFSPPPLPYDTAEYEPKKTRHSYGKYRHAMKIADFAANLATKTFAAATNGLQFWPHHPLATAG